MSAERFSGVDISAIAAEATERFPAISPPKILEIIKAVNEVEKNQAR
jgi:hypothetical protein